MRIAGRDIFFAAVFCPPVAVPEALRAMVDGADAGRAAGNGMGDRAGFCVAVTAVVGVMTHVDLAAVERVAITIGVPVEATGERAAPGRTAARDSILDHAR